MPMPTVIERATQSIHDVHQLIQTVFTQTSDESQQAIEQLMPAFAEHFSMVGITGRLINRAQVEQLFRSARGAKPGLEIHIGQVTAVWQTGQSVALRYQESHRFNGEETTRLSVAILECSDDGGVLWHYLHETAISA